MAKGITYEQVVAAADALVGIGQQPNIRNVREELGTGSPNTIHRHLVAWRGTRPPVVATVAPVLPSVIAAAILSEIDRVSTLAKAEIEGKLVSAQAESDELSRAGEATEIERDVLIEQVNAITLDKIEFVAKVGVLEVEIANAQAELKQERDALGLTQIELAKAQLRQDDYTARQAKQDAEIAWVRDELSKEREMRVIAERDRAVATATLGEVEKQLALAKVDVVTQSEKLSQLETVIESMRDELKKEQSDRANLVTKVAVLEAKADKDALKHELAELKAELKSMEKGAPVLQVM